MQRQTAREQQRADPGDPGEIEAGEGERAARIRPATSQVAALAVRAVGTRQAVGQRRGTNDEGDGGYRCESQNPFHTNPLPK